MQSHPIAIPDRVALPTMALVAGSLLAWEILLTRLASLRYHFHFGFLAVTLGLLGFGASGVALALWRDRWAREPRTGLRFGTLATLGGLLVSGLGLYLMPVHQGQMDLQGTASFLGFCLLGTLPFITGGGVIGLLLSVDPHRVPVRYGVDLLAAGAGCLGVLQALAWLGATGVWVGLVGAVTLAVALSSPQTWRRWAWGGWAFAAMVVAPDATAAFPAPSKITRPILQSTWTALSRVDAVGVARRRVRASGRAVPPDAIPLQLEMMQDGSASTLLTDYTSRPSSLRVLEGTLFSAAARLRPGGRFLVIGAGGGDDIWAALHSGASHVRAVDLNGPMVDIHGAAGPGWTQAWGERVDLVVAEGRHELLTNPERYTVVQMTGADTWAALSSGAYALAENYLYTTEAFSQMLDRVAPGGILQITRMAAEMEALRVLVQLDVALEGRRTVALEQAIAVLGSADHQVASLVQPDGFSTDEVAALSSWAKEAGLEVHHLPGGTGTGLISTFLRAPDRAGFIAAFPRDIRPTWDDSPYFFSFTRWTRPGVAAATIREPSHISQGNPLFVLGHLGLVLLGMGAALFLPLAWSRRRGRPTPSAGLLAFFGLVGLGFISVELGLIQKLSLLLGHPLRSLSVTLAGLLLASGAGAILSRRWVLAGAARFGVPVGLAAALGLLLLGLPAVQAEAIHWELGPRIGLALALVIPTGLLMGVPFAWGLRQVSPDHIPWAWAVNGMATVVGCLLSVVLSMTVGFAAVLVAGVGCYGLAFTVWRRVET